MYERAKPRVEKPQAIWSNSNPLCLHLQILCRGNRMYDWMTTRTHRAVSKRPSDLLLPRNIRLETFVTRSESMKYCAISPCVPTEKRIQLDWWRIFKWAHFNLKSCFCSLSKSSKNKELERKLGWYFVSSS